jgi:hypothetical protein
MWTASYARSEETEEEEEWSGLGEEKRKDGARHSFRTNGMIFS